MIGRIVGGGVALAAAWGVRHRTSPAVRAWRPPRRQVVAGGPLRVTATAGGGDPVILLLHGIVASGRSFGAAYDALPGTVVVPDLLGFGGSMDVTSDTHDVTAHIDALRSTLRNAGLWDRPTVVVGHSMGAVLGLHVAAAHPQVRAVVAVGAPLYDDQQEGLDRIGGADPLAALLTVGDLAERVCGWMCAHRRIAGVLWPLLGVRWPWPVARDGVLHTWPAYRGSLDALVLRSGWRAALDDLQRRGVPVHLLDGAEDGVPVPGRAVQVARAHRGVSAAVVDGADHALPLSHPRTVTALVERLLAER